MTQKLLRFLSWPCTPTVYRLTLLTPCHWLSSALSSENYSNPPPQCWIRYCFKKTMLEQYGFDEIYIVEKTTTKCLYGCLFSLCRHMLQIFQIFNFFCTLVRKLTKHRTRNAKFNSSNLTVAFSTWYHVGYQS